MSADDLLRAYLHTTYWVEAWPQPLPVRVGARCRALDRILARCGASCWTFITACNPRSRLRPDWYNAARQQALLLALRRNGSHWLHALAEGDAHDWPAEPGVLVLGMSAAQARRLGRRFGQNAVMIGERGKDARLVWCERDARGMH